MGVYEMMRAAQVWAARVVYSVAHLCARVVVWVLVAG